MRPEPLVGPGAAWQNHRASLTKKPQHRVDKDKRVDKDTREANPTLFRMLREAQVAAQGP